MNTKVIGDISTANIITQFLESKINVAIPFGDKDRYDLIIDISSKLYKVQCKTVQHDNDTIYIRAYSLTTKNGKIIKNTYHGQIDFIAAFDNASKKVYLIDNNEIMKHGTVRLRLTKPKNNQKKGVRFAENFELNKVLCSLMVKAPA